MKSKLLLLLYALFTISIASNAQIYADALISSSNVNNAGNAVNDNQSDYALMSTPIGLLNHATLKLGFTTYGLPGMHCAVKIQQDNGLLSVNVLQSLDIILYDTTGTKIGEQNGFGLADAELVAGSTNVYNLFVQPDISANQIGSVQITLKGLLAVLNKLRIYSAAVNYHCSSDKADHVYSSDNVINPHKIVNHSSDDYALMTPPLVGGSEIIVSFDGNPSARKVKFNLGAGNTIISAALLQNIDLKVYGSNHNVIAEKSALTLADVTTLEDGKFFVNVSVPLETRDTIAYAGISFSGLLNILTTLRAYSVTIPSSQAFFNLKVTPSGPVDICTGDPVTLTTTPSYSNINVTWQWYRNNTALIGANTKKLTVAQSGNYYVVARFNDGCSQVSGVTKITSHDCLNAASPLSLQVSPNPFSSYTTVICKNGTAGLITVTDKGGNLIESLRVNGGQSVKLLQNANTGIYFIKLTTNDGHIYTSKVIKQ